MSNSNVRDMIVPNSDQLNSEELISGPRHIVVTSWARTGSADQPMALSFSGDGGRPYKPGLTMRKLIAYAWGEDMDKWIGREMTLFRDPGVKWAGAEVGGIRISEMSDIKSDIKINLTSTKGKKALITVKKMDGASVHAALSAAALRGVDALREEFMTLPQDVREAMRESVKVFKQMAESKQPGEAK